VKPDIITDLVASFKLIPLDFFSVRRRICSAALAVAVAACGSGGGSSTPPPPTAPALPSATIRADADRVRSSSGCAAQIDALRSCIGFNNLPAPAFNLGPFTAGTAEAAPFAERTGLASGQVFAMAGPQLETAAAHSFVQVADAETFGIHLDTRTQGIPLSSINPLYQFERFAPAPGQADGRIFPWGGAFGEAELVISLEVRVRRLSAEPGSAAYGQAVLDLFDRSSGGHFYFLAQAYGTIPPVDNVLRDSATGKVIVATSFGLSSAYGRSFGAVSQFTPAAFVSPEAQGTGGHYEVHISHEEFQRVLNAARSLEPTLSASPADYMLDDFHVNNEVAGAGEIGVTLASITLRLARP
jgi:hypothetical protein